MPAASSACTRRSIAARPGPICDWDVRISRWWTSSSTRETTISSSRHARGFYVLDDITPLQQSAAAPGFDRTRHDLRPVVLALRGDPKDPEDVNLPGRVNWLTIQVGNNSGRPTAAQMEWIGTFADQTNAAVAKLEEIRAVVRKLY
jgi:hypothetical protein